MIVIAGLDPAIDHFRKKMDARVKPAHDGAEQRFNLSGLRCSTAFLKLESARSDLPARA